MGRPWRAMTAGENAPTDEAMSVRSGGGDNQPTYWPIMAPS